MRRREFRGEIECDGCGEAFTAEAAPSYLREVECDGELLTVCRHRKQCEAHAAKALRDSGSHGA